MPRLNFLLRYATLLGVFGALQFSNCAKAADLNVLATTALKPFFEQLITFLKRQLGYQQKLKTSGFDPIISQ